MFCWKGVFFSSWDGWVGLPGAASGCFSLFLSRLGYAFWRYSSNILKKYVLLQRCFFFKLRWIGRLPAAVSGCFPQFRIHDVIVVKAATRGHLRPLGKSGHLRPLEWLRVAASGCFLWDWNTSATRRRRPLAVTCGHSTERPLAATCGHSSGCEWLQVAAFLKFKYRAECNPNEILTIILDFILIHVLKYIICSLMSHLGEKIIQKTWNIIDLLISTIKSHLQYLSCVRVKNDFIWLTLSHIMSYHNPSLLHHLKSCKDVYSLVSTIAGTLEQNTIEPWH